MNEVRVPGPWSLQPAGEDRQANGQAEWHPGARNSVSSARRTSLWSLVAFGDAPCSFVFPALDGSVPGKDRLWTLFTTPDRSFHTTGATVTSISLTPLSACLSTARSIPEQLHPRGARLLLPPPRLPLCACIPLSVKWA